MVSSVGSLSQRYFISTLSPPLFLCVYFLARILSLAHTHLSCHSHSREHRRLGRRRTGESLPDLSETRTSPELDRQPSSNDPISHSSPLQIPVADATRPAEGTESRSRMGEQGRACLSAGNHHLTIGTTLIQIAMDARLLNQHGTPPLCSDGNVDCRRLT